MGRWLMVVHVAPVLLLPLLPLSLWLKLALLAAVVCSLPFSWQRHVRRCHPEAIHGLLWEEAGYCRLTLKSGRQLDLELSSQAFILPWMVILYFRTAGKRYRCLPVLSDMLDDEAFRQLRVRLRIAMSQQKP
jgi:hypothetical protein